MKNIILILISFLFFSCGSSSKTITSNALYEVLTEQETGGASIKFFEILSEENEINMLLSDENLKSKIKSQDIKTSNFILLNLGSKNRGGYSITVEEVTETLESIHIKTKEISPSKNDMVTDVLSNPYTIIKINSKKKIIFDN